MYYAVVWKLSSGSVNQVLIGSSDSLREVSSIEEAKDEARNYLAEISPSFREKFSALAIVEVNEHMLKVIDKCEPVLISAEEEDGDDLYFQDITGLRLWASQPWWPK